MKKTADIIDFPVKKVVIDDEVPTLKIMPRPSCFHEYFLIDDVADVVTCGQCKVPVSPFFALRAIKHQESRFMERHRTYKDEMQRLYARSRTKCEHCKQITRISD